MVESDRCTEDLQTAKHFQKVGVSFRKDILQKLDDYAERKFRGNRSAAANYLLGALRAPPGFHLLFL